jgi:hypothetical protein
MSAKGINLFNRSIKREKTKEKYNHNPHFNETGLYIFIKIIERNHDYIKASTKQSLTSVSRSLQVAMLEVAYF